MPRLPSGSTTQPAARSQSVIAAGAAAAGALSVARSAHAQGTDVIRIALVGAGGRGTGAALNALRAMEGKANVKLVAVADAFEGPVQRCVEALASRAPGQVDVPRERQFTGLDAYQQAIASGCDMVLLCSPPGFRPMHFEAAVAAGKHVFLEKPVACDGPGVRRILATNAQAKEKGLLVAVGHHLRHETKHREIVRRIHEGAIGELKYLRCYFNSGGVWVRPRRPEQTEMQFQVNNWYYFTWLSGDHIVEQHVHDLDVANWIVQGHPVKANGMGGRQVRIGSQYGEIFDHHSVEFDYPGGVKLFSYCRHIPGCWDSFSEHAHGTLGQANIEGHGTAVLRVDGQEPQSWKRTEDGHQTEHDDLFAALRAGKPYNEADWATESTMTAILGRMATYSGREVTWDEAMQSDLDLSPSGFTWDSVPQSKPGPDGIYPCALPGVTRAV